MKIITGYKGTDKDLKCRDHQYKVGKWYSVKGPIELCGNGFHFCQNPLDVLDFYSLCDSEFHTVEATGQNKIDGKKTVARKLKLTGTIGLPGFVKASVEYLWEVCSKKDDDTETESNDKDSAQLASSGDSAQLASSGNSAQLASSGNSAKLASSGYSAKLASSGDHAKLASSGDSAKLASSGYSAKLASSGNSAQLASSGNSAKLASSGNSAQLASSGNSAQLASSGDHAKLASSGNSAQLASSGDHAVVAGIGVGNIVKAAKGSWIVLAEWEYDERKFRWIPVCVRSEQVDGEKVKADTYYKLKSGEFVEAN